MRVRAYPVVSLAAEPTASEAVKAIKLGAVDYLSDHAGEAELLAALDSALRQRRTGVPDRFLHPELALEPMLDGMERELIKQPWRARREWWADNTAQPRCWA